MMNRNFKIFVVGGFVRDRLLGQDPKDMDFVVVGATTEELMAFGEEHNLHFKQVGADFPVFLDDVGREWAFARRERKTGPGYHGFEVEFDPTVTLEEDLFRRDLTINAMAMEVTEFCNDHLCVPAGSIIDPFNGQRDLVDMVLRPVSDHFAEDPVRVLRLARFHARLGFMIPESTLRVVRKMVASGELTHLVPERVWTETEKALGEQFPAGFFDAMIQMGACDVVFPGVREAWDRKTRSQVNVAELVEDRVALLVARMSMDTAHNLCFEAMRMPHNMANFALKFFDAVRWFRLNTGEVDADWMMKVFDRFDVFRDKTFLFKVRNVSLNMTETPEISDTAARFEQVFNEVKAWGFDDLSQEDKDTLRGADIGRAIHKLRKEIIEKEFS